MEIMVIAVIALIVLGPARLPEAARSLGKGMREMRDSFQNATDDDDDDVLDADARDDAQDDIDDDDADLSSLVEDEDGEVEESARSTSPA